MITYFFFTVILMLNVLIGFRETSNCFLREIYYSATSQQAKAYKKRCFRDHDEDKDPEVPKSGSGTGLFGDTIDIATTATRPNSTPTRTTSSSDSGVPILAPESTSTNGGETSPRAATYGATAEAASPPAQLMVTVAATELDARLREQELSLRAQFAEELDG
ncbi:hypothetical protein BGZ50_000582 [Haplosporangium sp. Z 11]|nr:hypothetical protein BGZ50_000582 [Haplosporangium sp. Z 11]